MTLPYGIVMAALAVGDELERRVERGMRRVVVAMGLVLAAGVAWVWWDGDEAQKHFNPSAYLDRQIQRLEAQIRTQEWLVRSLERDLAKKRMTREIDIEEHVDLLAGSGMSDSDARSFAQDAVDRDIEETEQVLAEARSQLEQYREQLREARQQRLELSKRGGG